MPRPRILLMPHFSELDWRFKPLLEEWAQVASFDAPGVGDEPSPDAFTIAAVVERGVAELDRQGWDRCVVVGDELGAQIAVHLAAAVPARLDALALGHACINSAARGSAPRSAPKFWRGWCRWRGPTTKLRSYAHPLLAGRLRRRARRPLHQAGAGKRRDRVPRGPPGAARGRGSRACAARARRAVSWRNTGAVSCSPPRATRKPWRPSRKPRAPPSTSSRARARSSRRRSAPSATSCPPRRPAWREDGARRPTVRGRLRLKGRASRTSGAWGCTSGLRIEQVSDPPEFVAERLH